IVAKQVDLSVTYGNTDISPSAYANYGLILCSVADDIEQGARFGDLALNLLDRIDSQEFSAKTLEIVCLSIKHWKNHIDCTLQPLLESYHIGLESGDFESASFAVLDYNVHSFVTGKNLADLEWQMSKYSAIIEDLKQKMVFNLNELHRRTVLNLLKKSEDPTLLQSNGGDEEKIILIHKQDSNFSYLASFYMHKLFLCYLFGDHARAVEIAAQAKLYLEGIPGQVFVPLFYFYEALSWLALYPNLEEAERKAAIVRISSHQDKIAKWANFAPMNYAHKLHLIQAEKYRVFGEKIKAIELYDVAIAEAKDNQYIQEEALANELTAQFYLDWNKEKIAAVYLQEAYYCYARWGAKAKTNQLEETYPQLLSSILQQQRVELNTLNSLDSVTQSFTSITQTKNSTTQLSDILDLASILQAAQTLCSTIEFNQLLGNIVEIILINAGGQKAVLLIPQDNQWQLQAMTKITSDGIIETTTRSQYISPESAVPIRLIQYVQHIQEPVLINEGQTEISGILEGYLLNYQPQSVLCVPLLNQEQLLAILYLEHATTKGVFTPNRVTIIQFLCTQAAISLQNAQLYYQAQEAIHDLEQAQLQLVQSEKMSALRKLVTEFAHEINNPTGFLQGKVQPAQDYVQDLLGLIDLYQQKMPHSDEEIKAKVEAIDLEFVREDLPKLLESMNLGIEEISNISNSLLKAWKKFI
ncbi:MAG: GAF domain-containing protein, partial [Symploca sp. SIO2C1]|nr:GAF domain-containing protein [Symploca sp. SIO2C1]